MSIEFDKVNVGDKLTIIGMGAPGFAKLGDVVTVVKTGKNRVDVTHDETGEEAFFALTCGASRLEPCLQGTPRLIEERSDTAVPTAETPA